MSTADGRRRPWLLAVAVALAVIVSTVVSSLFPSASMVWSGSQGLSAGVAVNTAVNVHNRGSSDYSEYGVSTGHIHGPPTTVNVQFRHEQTYYVLASNVPVLVHNTGPGIGGCGTGIANDLGNLPIGRQPHVRTVSSESELQGLYNKWSQGGTDITPNGFNGTRVQLPDGTIVQWRGASKSGGATIDLNIPGHGSDEGPHPMKEVVR